jgi:hypothetical protein
MDIIKMVHALRQERALLEEVISHWSAWRAWRAGRVKPRSTVGLDDRHVQRGGPERPSSGKQEQNVKVGI